MAGWRDRGYVPDSDEEEETEETGLQILPNEEPTSRDTVFLNIDDIPSVGPHCSADHGGGSLWEVPEGYKEAVESTTNIRRDRSVGVDTEEVLLVDSALKPNGYHNWTSSSPTEDSLLDAQAQAQLSAELHHEITAPSGKSLTLEDDLDITSPSSLPSSPPLARLSPPPGAKLLEEDQPPSVLSRAPEPSTLLGVVITNPIDFSYPEEAFGNSLNPARSLRQRKAIQLHPYALEGERYRQSLQARGLKPLRIAQAETEAAVAVAADSQERDFGHGRNSQPQTQTSPPSSSGMVRSVAENSDEGSITDVLHEDNEDDFPDVDVLLHHRPFEGVHHGYKRQKTSHNNAQMSIRVDQCHEESRNRGSRWLTSIESSSAQDGNEENGAATFDVPLSPPPSGKLSHPRHSQARSSSFRFPRGVSPRKPETPKLTSDPSHTELSSREISPDAEADDCRSVGSDLISESSGSLSESIDFVDPSHIRKVQRKIRGVLPASWLRLDQQTKPRSFEGRLKSKSTITSPNKAENGRGVARKVYACKGRDGGMLVDSDGPIEVSDDSETPEDDLAVRNENLSRRPPDRMQVKGGQARSTQATTDIWEDNRIDAMLPSMLPNRKGTSELNRKNKRQPHHTLFRKSHSSLSYQPKITDHLEGLVIPRSAKPRPKPKRILAPKLSIIDAPQSNGGSQSTTPPFIRIATRQARRRRDKGRHSPSRKFIKLHHRIDTNDTERVLQDWRTGSIAAIQDDSYPVSDPNVQRAPLVDRSWNEQQIYNSSTKCPPPEFHSIEQGVSNTHCSSRFMEVQPQKCTSNIVMQRSHTCAPAQICAEPLGQASPSLLRPTHKRNSDGNDTSLRPAQVEIPEAVFNHQYPRDAFRRGLSSIDLLFRDKLGKVSPNANIRLARFLASGGAYTVSSKISPDAFPKKRKAPAIIPLQNGAHKAQRKGRKCHPQRIDADTLDYRQPAEPFLIDAMKDSHVLDDSASRILRGLKDFGDPYSVDFDITQLHAGTFFHETTFIGSGDFAQSLITVKPKDFDTRVGQATIMFQGKALRWGSWNDRVSSELGIVLDWISYQNGDSASYQQADPRSNTMTLFRSVIGYFATKIHFSGSYERTSCLLRCIELLRSLLNRPNNAATELVGFERQTQPPNALLIATFCSVWANQLYGIAREEINARACEAKVQHLLEAALEQMICSLPEEIMANIRTFLEENRYHAKREAGIRDDHLNLECMVIAMQIIQQASISTSKLLGTVRRRVDNIENLTDAQVLEKLWCDTFTLLPLQEFDASGILVPGRRFRTPFEDWTVVQDIVTRMFTIYSDSSRRRHPSFNQYCCVALTRCYHLITYWGWRKCETIIGTIFDFFARNNLAHLRNAESDRSPRFLENLDKINSLEVGSEDPCFHIFLKILGTGFKAMCHVYNEKRIRDIAWRLMPNHGRSYPKIKPVRSEDLESLRNHHDLLCTLYWALPPSSRPRVSVIKNLVYPETAHIEACRINIRAWYHLVKFQLSTQEPASSLQPLADWHADLSRQILLQHNLAKTEAQSDFAAFMASRGRLSSVEKRETTIRTNQMGIEGILSELLLLMKNAMAMTKSPLHAKVLVGSSSIADVLDLFDPQTPRINAVIEQALHVVLETVQVCEGDQTSSCSQTASEDSQDYGSWPSDEEVANFESFAEPNKQTASVNAPLQDSTLEAVKHLQSTIFDALARLVSNAFGSDRSPSDAFLLLITDTWCIVAKLLVKHKLKHWSNYLAPYNRESWGSLRTTQQTRRYKAHFLSTIIGMDALSCDDVNSTIITSWLMLLAEPDPIHEYSLELTNKLLNCDRANPLFANLPFFVEASSGKYCITRDEFKQRRLSLISSVLANMREALRELVRTSPNKGRKLQQDYNHQLRKLMCAMKENFYATQPKTTQHNHYVEFVQAVVGFLHELTSDICPVDRFFTDLREFPLPTHDPTYVVGRLRNYGHSLNGPGVPKQLAVYIRTRSESAAQNDQQLQLSDHLRRAMWGTYEAGDPGNPTLRGILTLFIFPAYLKLSLNPNHQNGWILARPILHATQGMFDDLKHDFDPNDESSICSVADIITAVFDSLYQAMNPLLNSEDCKDVLEEPVTIQTLEMIFLTITSALPLLDFIKRRGAPVHSALRYLETFRITGILMLMWGRGDHMNVATLPCDPLSYTPRQSAGQFSNLQAFCAQELLEMMRKDWIQTETYCKNHEACVMDHFAHTVRPYAEGENDHSWGFKEFFEVLSCMSGLDDPGLPRGGSRNGIKLGNVLL
ncbi:MAG: hypothetical protein M1835_007406 [Candelina submexicana]|nr:MAG: hypothetical protein M1835_007406 [Candelina submexicana]